MPSVSSGPVVYEIPCACGKLLTITAGQAGSQITCECGALIDVPTIRELRRQMAQSGVAPAKQFVPAKGAVPREDFTRGALAMLGMVLVLIGVLTFGALYSFQKSIPQEVHPGLFQWVEKSKEQMDKAPPSDLWEDWVICRDKGLGDHSAFPEVVNKARAQGAWSGAYFGLGISGLGLVLLIISAVMPRRSVTA